LFQTNADIDVPSPPLNLRASSVTAGNIMLTWDPPADLGGASEVVGYILYQKLNIWDDAYFTLYDGQDSKAQSFLVRGLTRSLTYAFAVVALNSASFCVDSESLNISAFLEVSTLTYSRLTPPGQPYLVSATGGSITIGWSAPDDLAGVQLQGYNVELLNPISNEFEVLPSPLNSGTTTFTHYGLTESTSYTYTVSAFNQDEWSDRSVSLTALTTITSQPYFVENLRSIGATGGSITLAWDPPRDTGGRTVEFYEITQQQRSGTVITTGTTFTDRSGLSADTNYDYSIVAFNGVYRGYPSYVWSGTGSPSLPDPPLLNVVPFGGRLEVAWVGPQYSGGIPINDFVITLLSGDLSTTIRTLTTSELYYVFGGLVAETAYHLTGTARNSIGESSLVELDVTTSPVDAPGASPMPVASNILGGSVDIHVEEPVYAGGEGVTLVLYRDNVNVHSFALDEWDVTIYGLVAETTYTFVVAAKNTAGETKGDPLTVTTTVITTPGSVQNVRVVSVTFSQITLNWDAVQDAGGDEQLSYQVTYFKCSIAGVQEATEQIQIADSTSVVLEGLQYSSFYAVTVVAITRTSLLGGSSNVIQVATEQPLEGVVVAGLVDVTVKEVAEVVSVPISRVNGSYGNVSYSFETLDDSAVDGANYVSTSGTKTLTVNIISDTVDIPIVSDVVFNPGISFHVVVTDSTTGLQSTTTIHLEDDGDAGFISFAQPALVALESAGKVHLDITRTGGSSPRAEIQLLVAQNASSMDRFHLLDSMVAFEQGETVKTISVEIIDDSEFQYISRS